MGQHGADSFLKRNTTGAKPKLVTSQGGRDACNWRAIFCWFTAWLAALDLVLLLKIVAALIINVLLSGWFPNR